MLAKEGDHAGVGTPANYRILETEAVPVFVASLPEIRARLGGRPESWRVQEVGDGNLNLVFIVQGAHESVCVKQALPYVRVAGASWPMTLERAFFEASYYAAVAPFVGGLIPRIYHYDPELYCTVMECLAPHIILRQGLIAGRRYPNVGRDIGAYIARACFFTSDLARPFEEKMDGMALFARNKELVRITVDLVFCDPYRVSERNRHTSPQLDDVVADLRGDGQLKVAAARFGQKFLNEAQALVHGDLHSGSVMVTEGDTRVIDPEFAFYGPVGFDLGAFLGNLLLSWYSQPGHVTQQDNRIAYRGWILEQAKAFWESFRSSFLALWAENAHGDVLPVSMFARPGEAVTLEAARCALLDGLFADMLGFAACKMIRRIVGFAHVIDFERIEDAAVRAGCEAGALAMARALLTRPEQFNSIQDVIEAVPLIARTGAR
jgi:5-methylthioribose kinase